MLSEFYRVPAEGDDAQHGQRVGVDLVSSGGDQSAMRMIGYGPYVSARTRA